MSANLSVSNNSSPLRGDLESLTPQLPQVEGNFHSDQGPVLKDDAESIDLIKQIEERSVSPIVISADSNLRTRVTRTPRSVKGVINFSKVVWAFAWTIVRSVVAFTLLPVIFPAYSLAKTSKAAIRVLRQTEADRTNASESSPRSASMGGHKDLRPEAAELERLKYGARGDPGMRQQCFDYYNAHEESLFSTQGVRDSGVIDGQVDPEMVKLSRESYLNLNIVYRFDGPGMVGTELNFIQSSDNGVEQLVRYRVDRYFQDDHGLVGYGLVPVSPDSTAPPRLLFQGTSSASFVDRSGIRRSLPSGMKADAAGSIGKHAYSNQREALGSWLNQVTDHGRKKAFVSGHSLGGAITQRVAADYPQLVGEIFTLGSPRLKRKDLRNVDVGDMKITHVITKKDRFIPRVGGGRFSRGALLSSGNPNKQEVALIRGGGHTSTILNNYCMKGESFHFARLSVHAYIARDTFWPRIYNFIRPNINFM